MMAFWKKVKMKVNGKWYPKSVLVGTPVSTDQLSKRIAAESTVSPADVIAVLMSLIGLSPALGTFLAGVVLANSEYRHELESNIEPFKGLLLGLFFITVGAGVDFELLAHQGWKILGITLCVIIGSGWTRSSLRWRWPRPASSASCCCRSSRATA